jgi:hypothetical protein
MPKLTTTEDIRTWLLAHGIEADVEIDPTELVCDDETPIDCDDWTAYVEAYAVGGAHRDNLLDRGEHEQAIDDRHSWYLRISNAKEYISDEAAAARIQEYVRQIQARWIAVHGDYSPTLQLAVGVHVAAGASNIERVRAVEASGIATDLELLACDYDAVTRSWEPGYGIANMRWSCEAPDAVNWTITLELLPAVPDMSMPVGNGKQLSATSRSAL